MTTGPRVQDLWPRTSGVRASYRRIMEGIIVGVDGSRGAKRALAWAVSEARLRGADVQAVYAWTYPYYGAAPLVPPLVDLEALAVEAKALLDDAVSGVPADGVAVHAHLFEGPAARCLLQAGEDAELIVVGSRGRGGFAGLLLGSVSQQVASHGRCPVVVVPDQAA